MSVLVTGAAGHIGSNIVRTLLDEGEQVVGFDAAPPPPFTVVYPLLRKIPLVIDVSYVKDEVQGFLLACRANTLLNWLYNISSGRLFSIGEIAAAIQRAFARLKIEVGPRAGALRHLKRTPDRCVPPPAFPGRARTWATNSGSRISTRRWRTTREQEKRYSQKRQSLRCLERNNENHGHRSEQAAAPGTQRAQDPGAVRRRAGRQRIIQLMTVEYPAHVVSTANHSHGSSQTILVLEGVLTIEEDGAVHRVAAGGVINIPPGIPHRHSNYEDGPLRQLVIWNPPSDEVRGLR